MAQVKLPTNPGAIQVLEARQTLNATLMYLYHGYLNQGLTDRAAKESVAQEIGSLLDQWRVTATLEFQVSAVISPLRLLDGLIDTTKQEVSVAPTPHSRAKWQTVNRQLIDLRVMTKKEG